MFIVVVVKVICRYAFAIHIVAYWYYCRFLLLWYCAMLHCLLSVLRQLLLFIHSFIPPTIRSTTRSCAWPYSGSGLATYLSTRRGAYVAELQVSGRLMLQSCRYPVGLCCRAAGILVRPAGSGRGTRRFFHWLCWSSWTRCVPVSVCLLLYVGVLIYC